jgi:pimeloyl-ACP methyl ester carboxylesterase
MRLARVLVALGGLAAVLAVSSAPAAPAPAARAPAATEVPDSTLPGPGAFMGPVRRVPANGIAIGYRQFGKGSDLVLITGDTATMSLWGTSFPARLAEHFRVTMFDNRGVGYTTDDPSKPMSIPRFADDTAALIRALHLERPDVLGWSMGGEIGLTLSVRHPGVFRRLVTTGGDTGGRQAIQPAAGINEELNDPSTPPSVFLDLIFPSSAPEASAAFVQEYLSIPQEQVSASTLVRQGQAEAAFAEYEGTWKGLGKGGTRMLVTAGTDDVVVPPANAEVIVDRVGRQRARQVMFRGAGHGMWFQDMDRFVDLVVEYLRPAAR